MKKFLLLFLLFAGTVHAQTLIPGLRNPTDSAGQVPTSGLNGQVYWMSIDAGNIGGTTLASGITASSLTSFGSGIALGTPASGTLTNCTFPTLNQNTTGNAGTVTNGLYSTGSYSNPSWLTSISGGIVSGNISGNAANVTGTVAIANGGTGQTTANNALNALLPSQTGASGKVLQSDGTNTSWQTAGGGSVSITSSTSNITVSPSPLTGTGTVDINLAYANNWTASDTVSMAGATNSTNDGEAYITLQNTTHGENVVGKSLTQSSPAIQFLGHVANTIGGNDTTIYFYEWNSPQGSHFPSANLTWATGTDAAKDLTIVATLNQLGEYQVLQGFQIGGLSSSGHYLRGNGTDYVDGTIQVGDVPTLNQNTSGTAAGLSATLAVSSGGTGLGTLTAHDVLVGAGTSNVTLISPTSNTGYVLTSNGTGSDPTFQAAAGGGTVTSVNVAIPGMTSSGAITTSGTVTMSGSLSPSNGGTGVSNPTAHYVLVGEGSSNVASISPTTNVGYVLTSNGTGSDPTFQAAAGGGAFPVPVQVDSGGTGDITLTSKGVLYGNGTSAVGVTAAGNNGQFLTNYPNGVPAWGTTLGTSLASNTLGNSLILMDTTAAPSTGNQQYSPTLVLSGNGWKTTATAGSLLSQIGLVNEPQQNTSQPNARLVILGTNGSGNLSDVLAYLDGGLTNTVPIFSVGSGGSYAINGTTVLTSSTLGSGITSSSLTSLGVLTALTMNKAGIVTIYTENPIFENATASVSGTPVQQSPSTEWLSHVWSQTATAHDTTRAFDVTCVPISSTNPILADLIFRAGNGGTNMQPVLTLVSTGDLKLNTGHLTSASTIGSATDDGTGITSASVAGSDVAGTVTLTSASNAGGGTATIAFGTAYATAPTVVVTPNNALGVTAGSYYVTSTTAHFVINFPTTVVAASATFNYIVVGPTP
jgi:hypothetical protein